MMRFWLAYLAYYWGCVHRYFGNAHGVLAEHEAAVRWYTRALKIDPSFTGARLQRAVLRWRELGQLELALQDLDAVLAGDPRQREALISRAFIRQAQGDFKAALADLEVYLGLPKGDDYRDSAARTAAYLRELVHEGS